MGERLTKEREAEIRAEADGGRWGSARSKREETLVRIWYGKDDTADGLRFSMWIDSVLGPEHIEQLVRRAEMVPDLLAELDALRAASPTTYQHADGTEEPIGELVARLTRERDGWRLRADDLTSQRDGQERDAIAARAEAGAERKARMAMEARVRELLDAHAKLLDRLETAKARVRELEAERAGLVTAEAYGQATAALAETRAQLERMARRERLLVEEVNGLREEAQGLEAQLATLREAAEAVDEADASGDDTVLGVAIRRLRGALSIPGPTLAEIRRAAQVEVLRDAVDTACDAVLAAVPCCNGTAAVHAVRRSLSKRADDLEAGR